MLSKAELKLLKGLRERKERKESGLFIAEGEKIVQELLDHKFPVKKLFATKDWIAPAGVEVTRISEDDLQRISTLSTPNKVVALCEQPRFSQPVDPGSWFFMLDNIQDPGNLGTIIRVADWFGFSHVICSNGSVDVFNPKVIQSTMGSFINVPVLYADLKGFIGDLKNKKIPVYGMALDGIPLKSSAVSSPGAIVLGNESAGISPEILALTDQNILLPASGKPVAESLNVAVSAAIIAGIVRLG